MLVHQSGLSVNRSDKYSLGKDWSLSIIKVHTHINIYRYIYIFCFQHEMGRVSENSISLIAAEGPGNVYFPIIPPAVQAERMPDGREFYVQRFA